LPDKRTHRGAHPEDQRLFAPSAWPVLQQAVRDFSWLLSRGYAEPSSLKLVGDRYALTQRQRTAVMRCGCSDQDLQIRSAHQVQAAALRSEELLIDGYNILTTIESALAGGVILWGRDNTFRDLAGLHGTYRKVEETLPALEWIAAFLHRLEPIRCHWYLDSPVSNSGRLKSIITRMAGEKNWNWQVELVFNPDAVLSRADEIVISSDSEILNRCRRWYNLAAELISAQIPSANLINLSCWPAAGPETPHGKTA